MPWKKCPWGATIQLVINSNKSAYQIAHNIQTDDRRTTQKASSKETLEEENRRLRKELAIVKQEREILKKATAPQGHFL